MDLRDYTTEQLKAELKRRAEEKRAQKAEEMKTEYEAYDFAMTIVNKMNNPTMPTGKQILTADNEYLCKQLESILEPIIEAYKILKGE